MQAQAAELKNIIVQISTIIKGTHAYKEFERETHTHPEKSIQKNEVKSPFSQDLSMSNRHIISPDDVIPLDDNDDF
jgi:hypothetical protein